MTNFLSLLVICLFCSVVSFTNVKFNTPSLAQAKKINRESLMKRNIIPQAIFAAGCAGAVIAYVVANVDEVKEKQKIAVEQTMSKQADTIRDVQEKQRLEIERIQRQQQDAINKRK